MKKKNIFLIILVAIIVIGAFFYFFINKSPRNQENIIKSETKWHSYTNDKLGFSLNLPEEITGVYRCSPFQNFIVPVKVFEDNENGMTYIAPEYYYEAKWDDKLLKYVGSCEKINYSTNILRNKILSLNTAFPSLNLKIHKPFLGWAIIVKVISSKNELGNIIKDMFGKGCNYVITSTEKENIYQISFSDKNETDLGNTTCPTNFSYKFFYNLTTKKILYIELGQECSFFDDKANKCYDNEIINSLKLF
jgi:hypothetical protein